MSLPSNELLCRPNKSSGNIFAENEATFCGRNLEESHSSFSWPNVAEGQKLRVLKGCANESFAQKVQAQSSGKRTTASASVCFKDNVSKSVQELGSSNGQCTKPAKSLPERSLKKERNHKKFEKCKKTPLEDSHVCIIDRSKGEEWLQLGSTKQAAPNKYPKSLEEDFPDLTFALKVLSKCTIRHESENPAENCNKSSQGQLCQEVHSNGQKLKKKQPRRRDPISINIIDIIKKSDSCIRISPKNLQKIKNKDHERKTLGGNLLDSSNPIRKRGKHREAGPRKDLSKMKQIILSERLKKQELRGDLAGEISLVPEKPLGNPCVNSVCDTIVSLKIIDDSSTSCSHMQENSVKCSEGIKIKPAPECFPLDMSGSGQDTEIGDLPFPAISNNRSFSVSQNTVTERLRLNNIPTILHSRKFRDYCDNIRSKELDEAVTNLIKAIHGFQDRHYQKDPIRAHAKRRFVLGFREVKKFLMLKKLKSIVIAPDLEPVKSPGGLDETVIQIREGGRTQQVPVIFAVGRRQLGFALMKKVPISIVGIISSEGAEELYHEVLNQWYIAVDRYQQKISEICGTLENN